MLKRLYVDNYRCLVDFEFVAGEQTVLAGQHGVGRASLLTVMETLQSFLVLEDDYDGPLSDQFWLYSRTGWQQRDDQIFEVECSVNGENYLYRLQIAHGEDETETWLVREELACGGQPLFSFADGMVTLHQSDESYDDEWNDQSSALAVVLRSSSGERLRSYRAWWLHTLWTVNPGTDDFRCMDGTSQHPGPHLYDFIPWYRYMAQAEPSRIARLHKDLASVLPGFTQLEVGGDNLYALFASPDAKTPIKIALDDLAHAERVLIHLYTYTHLALQPGQVLWIAAPKASIAATAIGAWLQRTITLAWDTSTQLIVAVNEPEALDDVPPATICRFERRHGGRTIVSRDG